MDYKLNLRFSYFLFNFLKNETVNNKITKIATVSEIGAASKMPLMPVPVSLFSIKADKIIANGVKQIISRTSDAVVA